MQTPAGGLYSLRGTKSTFFRQSCPRADFTTHVSIRSSARSASLRYITWYRIKHGGCLLTILQILYSLSAQNLEQIQVFFLS